MEGNKPCVSQDEANDEQISGLVNATDTGEHGENLSDCETLFSICNGIMGTGLLAMGFVFRCGGLWALIIVPMVALFGNYTGKLLVELLYDEDKQGKKFRARQGYLDIGESLFPNFGKCFVTTVNFIENFAHAILILLMAGGIMNEIVPVLADDWWTVLCALPLLGIIFIYQIRSLAKVAMATVTVGTILVVVASAYSLYFSANWARSLETAKLFDIKKISLAIGITIVTYACQPYLPFIEKDMRNRHNFNKLMNISYIFVTILKMVSGFLVYFAYEKRTHPLMTLDILDGPLRTISSLLLLIVALTFFVFPMFTVFNIVEQNWPLPNATSERRLRIRYVVRSTLFMLAVMVAIVTPHFGIGIALVGNFTANILVFILPCLCHIVFNYPNISSKDIIIDSVILLCSIVCGSIGIVFSTLELVKSFSDEDLNPTEPIENL